MKKIFLALIIISSTFPASENTPDADEKMSPTVKCSQFRERFTDAGALQRYAGVAPVIERSGQKNWVHWRYASSRFVRQTFVEWAASSIAKSSWAEKFYRLHRSKGASRNATLRALAFKWIRVLLRCWVDRKPYDEAKYLEALQKRHSPLLQVAAAGAD